ncbi:hypothetical protein ACHQM5_014998 [Ranunculus cassubicifolius]
MELLTTRSDHLLANPSILKHSFSSSAHVLLFLILLFSWICNKSRKKSSQNRKQFLIASFSLSTLNFFLCASNYYYLVISHNQDWSNEVLLTQFDFVLRTLVWFSFSVYLYFNSNSGSDSVFIRIWWGWFCFVSCSSLILDVVSLCKSCHDYFDVISVGIGFYFCWLLFGKKKNEDIVEPLLSGSSTRDSYNGGENSCPLEEAGFFSIATFSWLNPLLALGNQKAISLVDVPQLSGDDTVKGIFPIFRNKLGDGGDISRVKLATALIMSTRREVIVTGFLSILYILASFVGPYLIEDFVQYLDGRKLSRRYVYMLVSGFILAKFVQSFAQRHSTFKLEQVGVRVQEALVATVYNTLLTVSCQSRQVYSSGEIVNFMAIDVETVSSFSVYLHDWWKVPFQIILAGLILCRNFGFIVSFATVASTTLLILAGRPLSKLQEKINEKEMAAKDERMKATSEIVRNMKVLKLQGWEMKFLSKIGELREIEEGWIRKYLYTRAVETFIFFVSPTIVAIVTFGTCVLIGIPLESGKILSAIATFGMLKEAIFDLRYLISRLIKAKVSLDRISSFLRLQDGQNDSVVKLHRASKVALEINNGNFSWDLSSANAPTLKDVNFQIFHGMRVGVCGTVGSGKSSLLSCMLGEMVKISGDIKLCGTKAYVAQSPWIQSGTVEENILFGKEMDRDVYERVLEACSLKQDLEVLSFGDQTIIGERGINLSGGQKQRIQIARALYQDADIYLFDDPFSALDAHTGMHLYKECLLKYLEAKTVIYVTNQVEFLPSADLVLVLKDGNITQSGKYDEILTSGTDFMELVGAHKKALLGNRNSSAENGVLATETDHKLDHGKETGEEDKKQNCKDSSGAGENILLENEAQLVQEEEREKGRVGIKVYWKYMTTYKGALVIVILVVQTLSQLLQIKSDFWMATGTAVSKDDTSSVKASTLILVYTALTLSSCIFVFVRAILIGTVGYKTATILFKRMHLSIFRAPMSFFDATPSGRILNRVSNDQNELDQDFSAVFGAVAMNTIKLIGVIGVMARGAWQVCIIYIPVAAACISYQEYYICAARELVRLTGVCSAPVKQHFAESISGLTTIKSFDQESRFSDTNMKLVDRCSRPRLYSVAANEWLGFRFDLLSSLTFASTLVFLVSMPQVRYASHLPVILRGITCTFHGGMKTGIVGRTGSGKSTLIQALFRLIEPTSGHILIDGIDISTIGLHDLRSKLSIIPQDPTMFEGTVRSNLDPLEEYTDEQIWETLDKCQLGDEVRKKEKKLDSLVTENGENWSMGQRQLVCLGRVLLKRSRILVLDEATSSVDTATDTLMQKTLRQHFTKSTVITIAHRITSVLDSDMVLVLDNGNVVEYDSPNDLLRKKTSAFAKLVAEHVEASTT